LAGFIEEKNNLAIETPFRGEFGGFPVFRFGSIVASSLGGCELDPVMHSFHRRFGSAAGRRRKMTNCDCC
jgi:hypothetical protein